MWWPYEHRILLRRANIPLS